MTQRPEPLQEAANPNTPPERLAGLAKSSGALVRSLVAKNPNTPTATLAQLINSYADEFAQNPVLPLLLLDQPNFFGALPEQAIQALARCRQLPEELYSLLVQTHPYTLARTPLLAPVLFPLLAASREPYVRERLALHKDLPVEILLRLARDQRMEVRRAASQHPSLPEEALLALADDKSQKVRFALVENPRTPLALRLRLLRSGDRRARKYLARKLDTPPALLAQLAQDFVTDIRLAAARNTQTPAESLAALASDPSKPVRAAVAANPSTPLPALQQLAATGHETVRQTIAAKTTTAEIIEGLARDPSYRVRFALAWNLAITDQTRWALYQGLPPTHTERNQAMMEALIARTRDPLFLDAIFQGITRAAGRYHSSTRPYRWRPWLRLLQEIIHSPCATRALLDDMRAATPGEPELQRWIATRIEVLVEDAFQAAPAEPSALK